MTRDVDPAGDPDARVTLNVVEQPFQSRGPRRVTDDAHVFDTLSGALLDLRIQLDVVPDLDVKIRRK